MTLSNFRQISKIGWRKDGLALFKLSRHRGSLEKSTFDFHSVLDYEKLALEKVCTSWKNETEGILTQIRRLEWGNNSSAEGCGEIHGDFEYFQQITSRKASLLRRKLGKSAIERILDLNHFVSVVPHFVSIVRIKPSFDHRQIAFTVSLRGTSRCGFFVKNIEQNVIHSISVMPSESVLSKTSLEIVDFEWSRRNLYIIVPDELQRPHKVMKFPNYHKLFDRKANIEISRRAQMLTTVSIKESELSTVLIEEDPRFFLDIGRSRDDELIIIGHQSKLSSEISILNSNDNDNDGDEAGGAVQTIFPRRKHSKYFVDHSNGYLYVATNLQLSSPATEEAASKTGDLKIFRGRYTDVSQPSHACRPSSWVQMWPQHSDTATGDDTCSIDDFDITEDSLVVYGRRNMPRVVEIVRLKDADNGSSNIVAGLPTTSDAKDVGEPSAATTFPEQDMLKRLDVSKVVSASLGSKLFDLTVGTNKASRSDVIRFSASNPFTPEISYSLNLKSAEFAETRRRQSSGSRDAALDFREQRESARSHDGAQVPITLYYSARNHANVAATSVAGGSPRPLLLVGYGAYGVPMGVGYDPQLHSLLLRGWTVAFAHTRGGGDLGVSWHKAGRGPKKWNTFRDFEACAEHLIEKGYTTPAMLCASGSSAGGLIMGVMANNRPDLFAALILRYPFLDPLGTLQRPEEPLTIHEYEEFGDPRSIDVGEYLRSYSPCSNVRQQRYPRMFITTAMLDTRVAAREALLWVSLLREADKGAGDRILLKVLRDSGHDGPNTLDEHQRLAALEILFLEKAVKS